MSDVLTLQSHRGPYTATFASEIPSSFGRSPTGKTHVLVDQNVAELHATRLKPLLDSASVLRLSATEEAKSLESFPAYVEHLVANKVRRGDLLLGIGGGIIQDITCFLAATLLRGIDWAFVPTTLLAQADSCIGSKSSINSAGAKNLLGTFTPPREIHISPEFIATLLNRDIRSGIGEMIKVHAIAGSDDFAAIERDYAKILASPETTVRYIWKSLAIKKTFIETDEFDKGPRNVLNYGHCFGHAIEAVTEFAVPHGIAVTIGMDFANFVSWRLGFSSENVYRRMKPVLGQNAQGFGAVAVPIDGLLRALAKDKKNIGEDLGLILMNQADRPVKVRLANDARLRDLCQEYLTSERLA